jgi:hypothetical protein
MHSSCWTSAAAAVWCYDARQDPIRRLGVWAVQMWRGIHGDSPTISLTCDARRLPPEASSSWSYSVTPNSIALNVCYPFIPVMPGRLEIILFPLLSRVGKSVVLFEGSQGVPACPSDKTDMSMGLILLSGENWSAGIWAGFFAILYTTNPTYRFPCLGFHFYCIQNFHCHLIDNTLHLHYEDRQFRENNAYYLFVLDDFRNI